MPRKSKKDLAPELPTSSSPDAQVQPEKKSRRTTSAPSAAEAAPRKGRKSAAQPMMAETEAPATEEAASALLPESAAAPEPAPTPLKRGRSPKAVPAEADVAATSAPKPRRGRRAQAAESLLTSEEAASPEAGEAPTLAAEESALPETPTAEEAAPAPVKRGRKPKAAGQAVAEPGGDEPGSEVAPAPARRGRRPKALQAEPALPEPVLPEPAADEPLILEVPKTVEPAKGRRGRPRKEQPAPLSDVLEGVEAVEVSETVAPEPELAHATALVVSHTTKEPPVDSATVLEADEDAPPATPEPRQSRRKAGRAEQEVTAVADAGGSAPGTEAEPEEEGASGLTQEADLLIAQLRKLGRPVHVRDLERTFTRQALDRLGGWRNLTDLLEDLVESGQVVRTRKKTYGLPEAMSLVRGKFQASAAGFGFVVPDSSVGQGGGEDYYISPDKTMEAWNGDIVLVRMDGRGDGREGRGGRRGQRGDGNPRATVVRIVQRAYRQLVGTLEFSHGHPILRPDDHRARHRILLLPEGLGELEAGARVVSELYWPENTGEDEVFGQVVRVLGAEDDPETETEAVIVKYGLRGEFPDEVLEQANAIPVEIPEEALIGRLDLRSFNIFTVDGRDAKDFDDAIHIQPVPDGNFVVGVHIADVSHYVAEDTPLGDEAYARATSVYLPGRVLPMLPEHLSNGVCSLVPYQDRLTMTALIELSPEGEILDVKITPSVINSKARLTYDEVQAYSEATATLPEHARHLEGDLHLLLKITTKLRQRRLREGSLDFKLREVKVDVDKDGRMELIPIREETARGMIEDLMLLANKVVARFLIERDIPTLFRVHEEPTLQKFQEVTGAIGRLGFAFPGGEPTPQAYQAVLKQVRGTGRESVVNTLLLRSMQQAKYGGENLGHFGLAFDEYLHFTSPIRRYPDLVVHRTLKRVLEGEWRAGGREVAQFQSRLPAMGEHTSDRERTAAEAERDLTKYYQCKWAQEHLGESFTGNVSGVVSSGLYVALENGVEGKLHISHLDDDYYIYIEDAQMLKGRSSGRSFRLGDPVEVTISAVKPLARQTDLTLADPSGPEYKPGSIELPGAGSTAPVPSRAASRSSQEKLMTDVKVRARRREDREQERQEKLKALPVTQPRFTLDDEPAARPAASSAGSRPRNGAASRGRTESGRAPGRTFGGAGVDRSPAPGRGGAKRVITLERPRNEHLRPVNITAQRMYFGDWTTDHMPEEEGSGGPRAGRERGYVRGERRGEGRGYTRGGNDRGAVRSPSGAQGRTPGQAGGARAPQVRTAPASAPTQAAEAPSDSAAQGEDAKRRRRRRGRRSGAAGPGTE